MEDPTDTTPSDTIFFITPLGDDGSPQRIRADAIFDQIEEAAEDLHMRALRSDRHTASGAISVQIVEMIAEASVVVADLAHTNGAPNPNVMYELGLADAYKRPVVLLSDNMRLPFDVSGVKATIVPDTEWRSIKTLRAMLTQLIQKAREMESPISIVTLAELRTANIVGSADVNEVIADLRNRMDSVETTLGGLRTRNVVELRSEGGRSSSLHELEPELRQFVDQLADLQDWPDWKREKWLRKGLAALSRQELSGNSGEEAFTRTRALLLEEAMSEADEAPF